MCRLRKSNRWTEPDITPPPQKETGKKGYIETGRQRQIEINRDRDRETEKDRP